MNELALFAGAGGGILGGKLLGWRTVCAVERDAYAAQILAQRQNDGILEAFPIWSDVQSFDGKPWRGIVDVISGGFPCQDISVAGKGAGIEGERSGMWKEFARIIGEVRSRYVYIENSTMLTIRGLDRVLCDLAALGYDAEWMCLSASECGAPHKRDRIWIVGHTDDYGQVAAEERSSVNARSNNSETRQEKTGEFTRSGQQYSELADANGARQQGHGNVAQRIAAQQPSPSSTCRWPAEPNVGRVADGVAFRVDRLKAIGNGQVSKVAARAFIELTKTITNRPQAS